MTDKYPSISCGCPVRSKSSLCGQSLQKLPTLWEIERQTHGKNDIHLSSVGSSSDTVRDEHSTQQNLAYLMGGMCAVLKLSRGYDGTWSGAGSPNNTPGFQTTPEIS